MKKHQHPSSQNGFTLVELAVVLVIVGILTGGVLVGQDLIRAAELNRISTEAESYKTAVNTFKLKYGGLPGDLDRTSDYWPSINPSFNGDNDGTISWMDEGPAAWQSLALADLASGSYRVCQNCNAVGGDNAPESNAFHGTWTIGYHGYTRQHNVIFGLPGAALIAADPILSPLDAESIDRKADDGNPSAGSIWGSGANCLDSGNYDVDSGDTPACALDFPF